MQSFAEQITKIVNQLDIALEGSCLVSVGFDQSTKVSKENEKKLKKKIKKFGIEKDESPETSIEKTKKMLDEVYKAFEATSKQNGRVQTIKNIVDKNQTEKDNSESQIKIMQSLHKGFLKKYNEKVAEAQNIEKQEENKRKVLIEQLQERIKKVQDQYEAAGKVKIQKYRENQTLKHELSKIQPQLITSQSLFEAQLKKKQIEVEISMTTLKQKIEMMQNFKTMGAQTKTKIEKAGEMETKIQPKLQILNKKQEEHKILLARAHLTMEEYKKSIIKINELLGKNQKQALQSKQKLKKAESGLKDINTKLTGLDDEINTHNNQVKMLLTLEENLKKELACQE